MRSWGMIIILLWPFLIGWNLLQSSSNVELATFEALSLPNKLFLFLASVKIWFSRIDTSTGARYRREWEQVIRRKKHLESQCKQKSDNYDIRSLIIESIGLEREIARIRIFNYFAVLHGENFWGKFSIKLYR